MALLWPEADEERARNSLKQTISALRGELGDDLFIGTAELQLNQGEIACDIWEFERARAAGDYEGAVAAYRGPLLDGVHLRDGHEFAAWADAARARLAAAYLDSLERLARRCEADGDVRGAIEWWRRIAAVDPLASRGATGLVRALAAAGHVAEALQHARVHEQLVRNEMGAEVAPEIRALVERLRAGEGSTLGSPGPTTGSGPQSATAAVASHRVAVLDSSPVPTPNPWRSRRRVVLAAAITTVMLTLLVARVPGPAASPVLDPRKVVVGALGALESEPAGSESDAIGQLVADWITQGLVQTRLVTVVPADALSDSSSGGEGRAFADQSLLETARAAGAGLIVASYHNQFADSVHLGARVIDARDGKVLRAIGPVAVPHDAPLQGAEALRQRVMAALASVVDQRLANWSSSASQPTNFEAYQAFADGLAAFFDPNSSRDPNPYFLRAHALDTTFTAPLLWTFFRSTSRGSDDSIKRYLGERRSKLPPWDQGLLDFFTRKNNEDGYQAFRRVVDAAPESEWLYMLAWTATPTNRPAVAVRALERLDPDRGWMRDWPSYWTVLADAHHFLGQHEQELAAARRGRLKFPMDLGCLLAEVKALAASNRVDELERALAELSYASPLVKGTFQSFDETIRELRRHGHAVLAERLADRLTAELEARNGPPMIRLRTLWAVGRWERAAPLLQELAVKSPQSVPLLEMRALLAASRGNRFEAERLAGEALAAGMIVPYHADLLASIHALFGEYAEALEKLRATAADRRAPRRLHLLLPDTMHEYAPFREFASRRYDDPEVFPARRRR